ncbi:MAG: HIT domain-containing protein [Patescibacteria group bacterium]|nr:HIT domain-containing protein [Patescibacteria group bacterium]
MECVFCKIRDREIPKEFTYEDDEVMVFPDIHPIKPVHFLVVLKKHVEDFLDVEPEDLEKLAKIIKKIVKDKELGDKGYRLGINGGGAQIIEHLHVHLMSPFGKQER